MAQPSTPIIGGKVGSINMPLVHNATLIAHSPISNSAPGGPNRGQVFVTGYDNSVPHTVIYGLTVVDLLAQKVIDLVGLGEEPTDIVVSPDGSTIYLSGSENLLSIQTGSYELTKTPLVVPPGAIPGSSATFPLKLLTGMAITADGSQLLIAGQQNPPHEETNCYLALVDLGTNAVHKAVTSASSTDFQFHRIALTPDGRYAAVNLQMQRLDIIDLESFSIAKSVAFNPAAVLAVAAHPTEPTLYVATGPLGGASGSVAVVDIGEGAVIATIDLPSAPHQLAVSPNGKHLLVTVHAPGAADTVLVLCASCGGTQEDSLPNAGLITLDPDRQQLCAFDAEVLTVYGMSI